MEGVVDGIESTMSSVALIKRHYQAFVRYFHKEKGYVWLSTRSLKASFSASDEKVIPSENLHPAVAIFSYNVYLHVPGNYSIGTKDTF